MDYVPYNVPTEEMTLLRAWPTSEHRPALLVTAPTVRNVGERELVANLHVILSAVVGYADSPARHYVERLYPHDGTSADYARFEDEPLLVSEICNEFTGIDCIDLTEWVGQDLRTPRWSRFLDLLRTNKGSDYVLLAYTDNHELGDELARSVMSRCGMAVLRIHVMMPTCESLAAAFEAGTGGAFSEHADVVREWLDGLLEDGRVPNYSYVSNVASMAAYACRTWENERAGLEALLCEMSRFAPDMPSERTIGF